MSFWAILHRHGVSVGGGFFILSLQSLHWKVKCYSFCVSEHWFLQIHKCECCFRDVSPRAGMLGEPGSRHGRMLMWLLWEAGSQSTIAMVSPPLGSTLEGA